MNLKVTDKLRRVRKHMKRLHPGNFAHDKDILKWCVYLRDEVAMPAGLKVGPDELAYIMSLTVGQAKQAIMEVWDQEL